MEDIFFSSVSYLNNEFIALLSQLCWLFMMQTQILPWALYLDLNHIPVGMLDWVSLPTPTPTLAMNGTFHLFGCSYCIKLSHCWQVRLGSLERGRFREWTTISSVWRSFVNWKKVDCCWRVAPTMVCSHRQGTQYYGGAWIDSLLLSGRNRTLQNIYSLSTLNNFPHIRPWPWYRTIKGFCSFQTFVW